MEGHQLTGDQGKRISVEYCSTNKMKEDCFTKHLQRSLFKKFCNWVLNTNNAERMKNKEKRGNRQEN
eukprot:10609554-Ditylum_brightwellii.AAC.1